LRAHHEERSAKLLEALAAYSTGAQAWQLASALFEGRLRGADDQRFALVETLAHLERLCNERVIVQAQKDGAISYSASTQQSIVNSHRDA